MSRKTVAHADETILFFGKLLNFFALRNFKEQRLFANDMQASFESRFNHFVMQEVRRSNVDNFDAVLALCLFGNHRFVVGIEAVFVDAEIHAEFDIAGGIHVERAADQFKRRVVVECAATMFRTYVSGSASANHSPAQRTFDFLFANQHFEKLLSIKTVNNFDD